jgi:hypothetical protein
MSATVYDMLNDVISPVIESHLERQPYSSECARCDASLEVVTDVDGDGDVNIRVQPCDKCLEVAREEGRDEVRDELQDQIDRREEMR